MRKLRVGIQEEIYALLSEKGALRPRDIAEILGAKRSSVSNALMKMKRKGLVKRIEGTHLYVLTEMIDN